MVFALIFFFDFLKSPRLGSASSFIRVEGIVGVRKNYDVFGLVGATMMTNKKSRGLTRPRILCFRLFFACVLLGEFGC